MWHAFFDARHHTVVLLNLVIPMAVCNKVLDLYEVQEGYYACENQDQIVDWLSQRPTFAQKMDWYKDAHVSTLVTYEKGSFHVYFLVQEASMGEHCLWLLYIPNYLSKHFDLLCFSNQYPELDTNKLFHDLSTQFAQLTASKGHPLPVSGCRHSVFTGFMYDIESMFSKN